MRFKRSVASMGISCLLATAGSSIASSQVSPRPGGAVILERLELHSAPGDSYEAPELITTSGTSSPRSGAICGTPAPTETVKDRFDSVMAGWHTMGGEAQMKGKVKIPVVFWIIQDEAGRGSVTESQLYSQIDVLNWAYRNSGIVFQADSGWLVTSNKYHKKCGITKKKGGFNGVYKTMTKKLTKAGRVDPAKTLNLYTCDPKGKLLGEAFAASNLEIFNIDESHHLNGVVVDYRTLPGGNEYPYNAGATAAHEVGHYFGLLHTFFPNELPGMTGCDYPGDSIDDTPYEKSPAYEAIPETNCAKGRDTCPQLPKKDPVTNFMDYSSDYCKAKFSGQQKTVMRTVIEIYRPSLMR